MFAFLLLVAAGGVPCTSAALPPALTGWTRSGEGLDTRHAVVLDARQGAAETQVTIRKAGTFGIAIDQPGWVDLAGPGGRAMRLVSRDSGIACAKIDKIVYYRLQPGTYRVTLKRLNGKQVKLMLVHRPGQARGFARSTRLG